MVLLTSAAPTRAASVLGAPPVRAERGSAASVRLRPAEGVMTDDAAFAQFVRANMSPLSRTAYLMTGSTASAEDLVQETLLRLYRRRDWLLNADVPLAYARRALANQFVNDRRRAASREIVLADVPESRTTADSANAVAERDAVWQLLEALPDRQRAAVVLRYYHDLPDKDIAEALECRVGTVRSLISRALSALRQDPVLDSITGGKLV